MGYLFLINEGVVTVAIRKSYFPILFFCITSFGHRIFKKPLKSIERIILTGSKKNDLIVDFFAHAGTTLIAAEKLKRRCFTMDNDPVFAEITIRRLENLRKTGKAGWQVKNPFPEIVTELDLDVTENTKIPKLGIGQAVLL